MYPNGKGNFAKHHLQQIIRSLLGNSVPSKSPCFRYFIEMNVRICKQDTMRKMDESKSRKLHLILESFNVLDCPSLCRFYDSSERLCCFQFHCLSEPSETLWLVLSSDSVLLWRNLCFISKNFIWPLWLKDYRTFIRDPSLSCCCMESSYQNTNSVIKCNCALLYVMTSLFVKNQLASYFMLWNELIYVVLCGFIITTMQFSVVCPDDWSHNHQLWS